MARQPWGAGLPCAGAGKILPRPRRTVGGEKRGDRSHTRRARGREPPCGTALQVLVALVLVVFCIGAKAPLFRGVHPLAVGHPPGGGLGLLGLSWPMARG
jgi:hypothetical protein